VELGEKSSLFMDKEKDEVMLIGVDGIAFKDGCVCASDGVDGVLSAIEVTTATVDGELDIASKGGLIVAGPATDEDVTF